MILGIIELTSFVTLQNMHSYRTPAVTLSHAAESCFLQAGRPPPGTQLGSANKFTGRLRLFEVQCTILATVGFETPTCLAL